MQTCPICHQHPVASSSGKLAAQALSEHLQRDHASVPCFLDAQKARPWRCPLCPGGRRNYASAFGLAKHLTQEHASATVPTADGPTPQAASGHRPASAPAASSAVEQPMQPNHNYKPEPSEMPLRIPCLPWLPRPKWWLRPPSATLILATWNLEHFSVGAADSGTVAKKVAHICETLRMLCSREGHEASVVVALQEVFCARAASFLAAYLTEKDAAEGGSGRIWHGVTSDPLGNNPERSAFLWAGPPQQQQTSQRRRGPPAPLHADASCSFQLLREEDFETVIRAHRQQQPGGKPPGHFIRSPYYGLFRVGYANLLLVNVHLAAEAPAARSELSALHSLAAAIQQPNCRLLRRHSLGGRLRGRKPRGLVAILGDFNCPISTRAIAAGTATPPGVAGAAAGARGGGSTTSETTPGAAARGTSAGGVGRPGPLGEGREQQQRPQQPPSRQEHTPTAPATTQRGNNANGKANGSDCGGANGPSWEAFFCNGWVNALSADRNDPTTNSNGAGNGNGSVLPLATNWRAKQLKALDAICLPRPHEALVKGRGVCSAPPHVDASQKGEYPNHLLCWVRLDLGPLQLAPGKVRSLLAPARLAAGAAASGSGSGSAVAGAAAAARAG